MARLAGRAGAVPAIAFLVGSLLAGCEVPPGGQIDLVGTSWTVASIGGIAPAPETITISIGLPTDPAHSATALIQTPCRTVSLLMGWNPDGDDIWLQQPDPQSLSCPADQAKEDAEFFAAWALVERWSVESSDAITFHGQQDISLRRLDTWPSPTHWSWSHAAP
jgi:hypothetical protein